MSHSLKPLDQQVVVVTGASSGIGLCTATLAAEAGAKVVLAARSEETLGEIVDTLRAHGGDATAVTADVSDRAQVQAVADAALAAYGRIDTWINNAGVSIFGRLDEVEDADNRRLFDINFWGVVNGSLVALPHLKSSGGALINLGSEASEAALPLQGMYSASKHAVKGFTDALRVEQERVDKAAVSITLIQPTAVDTPYPENARNYLDAEPKLPTPMLHPQKVAHAILKAATEGGRDVKVGAMSVIDTRMSTLLPALADRASARQAGRQTRKEPAHRPEGTLYAPGESGRIQGRGNENG